MKVKAILRGNELTFSTFTVLKKPEVEVEVELPDDAVQIYTEEELERMSLDELAHLIWGGRQLTEEQIAHLNKDYKELVIEAFGERYKE